MYEIKYLFLVLHVFRDHVMPAQTYPIYAVLFQWKCIGAGQDIMSDIRDYPIYKIRY
jgi:hypothetical protein